MKFLKRITAPLLLSAIFAAPGQAAIVTYTDQAAYNAATTANTTLTFASQTGFELKGASYIVNGVVFGEPGGRLSVLKDSAYGTHVGADFLNNNNGSGSLTITFPDPVTAFSLVFGAVVNFRNVLTPTETFNFAGETVSYTLPGYFNEGSIAPSFIGFSSDTAFTNLIIEDSTHGLAISKLQFGSAVVASVPEPAPMALLALGLLGVAAARRGAGVRRM